MSNLLCTDPYGFVRSNCDGNLYDEPSTMINVPADRSKYENPIFGGEVRGDTYDLYHYIIPNQSDDEFSISYNVSTNAATNDLVPGLLDSASISEASRTSSEIPEPSLLILFIIGLMTLNIRGLISYFVGED